MDERAQTIVSRQPMPASAGIGLRAQHHLQVLSDAPRVGWFEAHSENYFADGGAHVEALMRIRARYPLSLHGVGLSLGSTDPWDRVHLQKLRRAIGRFEPALVSEHCRGVRWAAALPTTFCRCPTPKRRCATRVPASPRCRITWAGRS